MWGSKQKETKEVEDTSHIGTFKVTYISEGKEKEDIVNNVAMISQEDSTYLNFFDKDDCFLNSYLKHTVLKFERIK